MRINALSNTATDFASDDYIALDGATNGSRKMKNDVLLQKAKDFMQTTNREVVLNYIFANNGTNPSDLNDLKTNAIYLVQRTAATTTSNFPSDFGTDSSNVSILEITTAKYASGANAFFVTQKLTILKSGVFWTRTWSYDSGSWTSWVKTDMASDLSEFKSLTREVVLNYIFTNNATNPSDLNDLKSNAIYIVQRTAATTTSNFPSDFPNDSKVAILEITTAKYGSGVNAYLVSQRLTIVESGIFWTRRWTYASGTWTTWVKVDIKSDVDSLSAKFATYREVVLNYIFANNATNPADLNDLKSNAIYIVQKTAATTTSNFPSDFPNDSKMAILEITTAKYGSGSSKYAVTQKLTSLTSGTFWTRFWTYDLGTWSNWVKIEVASANKHITIGSGGDYATLREGIAEAIKIKGCLVDVLPGTYDLEVEFADALPDVYNEISKGIKLDNDIHVRFHDGAKVLANFTDGDYSEAQLEKIAIYFQPFFANTGSFVLENLDIEATNTRYCVHDENAGVGNYFRKYLNCKMVYHNTLTNSYARFHAIGGGLGLHGTIVIDGGSYKVTTPYGNPQVNDSTGENSQMCILYHNGYAAGCESSIVIKNVYFEDRGYIKIGWWGASTIKSRVFINGNSFGLPVLHIGQRYDAQADNFEVTEWNNEQRVQNVEWQINPNGYEATLVTT